MFEDQDIAASFVTVRGSMCKIFRSEHAPDRVSHKSLGVIHPVHEFNDPRESKSQVNIEARIKQMSLFDFSTKYREKSFLPEHLTTPFIYIERVVNKGNAAELAYNHPDQWNKSNNVHSTRIQTQIPKKELSELTRSIVKSKREKDDKNDYEQNERMKKYVKFFFKQITALLTQKRFAQDVAKQLIASKNTELKKTTAGAATSATVSNAKSKQPFQPKPSPTASDLSKKPSSSTTPVMKEFIELDRDYTLREIWKAFCKVRKVECADDQEVVDLKVFQEFIREGLGYLAKKWSEIDKYYDYFNKQQDVGLVHPKRADGSVERAEDEIDDDRRDDDFGGSPLKTKTDFMYNSSLLQWRPVLKKIDKSTFSMRAFIFNYEKFLKDSEKISYVLSERAATERKVSLKHVVNNYFVHYDKQKQIINDMRDLEDDCKLVIKGIASEYDDPDVKREVAALNALEETTKQGHRFSKEEKNGLNVSISSAKERVQGEMEKFNELYNIALNQLTNLWNDRDRVFFEKRILMRYLRRVIQLKEHLVMSTVDEEVGKRLDEIEEEFVMISTFYEDFIQEKDSYDEKALKLVELATYIHENNLSREELERVAYFIKKLKSNYNVSRGQEKSSHIEPNQSISIGLLAKTFTIFKEKRDHEKEVLQNLVDHFAATMDAKMPIETAQRVRAKIEVNLIYDTFDKIMEDYDEQLEAQMNKIKNIILFILQDKEQLPKQFKNFLGYLIWGIYDKCDEYLPLEIREKITLPELDDQQSRKTRLSKNFNQKASTNTFSGDIFSLLKPDGDDDDVFDAKKKNNRSGNNNKDSMLIEEDEDFAIDVLNRRNIKNRKPSFLNENDISHIEP